jgi:hypothetical protein
VVYTTTFMTIAYCSAPWSASRFQDKFFSIVLMRTQRKTRLNWKMNHYWEQKSGSWPKIHQAIWKKESTSIKRGLRSGYKIWPTLLRSSTWFWIHFHQVWKWRELQTSMQRLARGFLWWQDHSVHVLARVALRRRKLLTITRAKATRDQLAVFGAQQPANRIPRDS